MKRVLTACLMLLILALSPGAAMRAAAAQTEVAAGIGGGLRDFGADAWYVLSSPTRINRSSTLWIGASLAVGGLLYAYDEDLYAGAVRSRGTPVYDAILDVGTAIEPIGFVVRSASVAGAGLLLGHAIKAETLQDISGQILESHLISSIVRNGTKQIVGRARPEEGLGAYEFEPGGGNSFPSGHTSIVFEIATVLSHHADWWPVTVASYGLASSLALQRVDSGKHWASDVFIPMISGTLIAQTVIRLHEQRKLSLVPAVSATGSVGVKAGFRF